MKHPKAVADPVDQAVTVAPDAAVDRDAGILKALSRIVTGDRILGDIVGRRLTFRTEATPPLGMLPIVTGVVTPDRSRGDGTTFRLLHVQVYDLPGTQRDQVVERLVELLNPSAFAFHGAEVKTSEVRQLTVQPELRADLEAILEVEALS